ncbi:hypothetical protein Pla163_10620 [Planctomycetes bacterium Pla163]|uniref:Alpha/beta hydrolase fold protein n=2 Tax=Rohdeia mirabilis TaxID=2528008 RepID=A0A518CXK4_9BACT|nr:hypothetical protein Pla163_10620 [Planctomycetes bacterium Pla163]
MCATPSFAQGPPAPVRGQWGQSVAELFALWEAPSSDRIVWFLPGGGWQQSGPQDFGLSSDTPTPFLADILASGTTVGTISYRTSAFPLPEFSIGDLVAFSRRDPNSDADGDGQADGIGLGKKEVILVGRSAGAYMALFNGIVESDPLRRADRVVTLQLPAPMWTLYDRFESNPVFLHFGSIVVGAIDPLMLSLSSSAAWPFLVRNLGNQTEFFLIGSSKALEFPVPTLMDLGVPLPWGSLRLPEDIHPSTAPALQDVAMRLKGYRVQFVETFLTGRDPMTEALTRAIAP